MRVEIYGSVLNAREREKTLSGKGIMIELGKEKRSRWKLSFDKESTGRKWENNGKKGTVLNFVETQNPNDVYYTTVYEVDDCAYCRIMDREMKKINAEKWRQHEEIRDDVYRPKQLVSEKFGKTVIFVIPEEGRKPTSANKNDRYVEAVRKGITESYQGNQLKINLDALDRAIKESQNHKDKNAPTL
jgi:hypothetical protein